jgi:hypothetical protein
MVTFTIGILLADNGEIDLWVPFQNGQQCQGRHGAEEITRP